MISEATPLVQNSAINSQSRDEVIASLPADDIHEQDAETLEAKKKLRISLFWFCGIFAIVISLCCAIAAVIAHVGIGKLLDEGIRAQLEINPANPAAYNPWVSNENFGTCSSTVRIDNPSSKR
jgi:hypothetical protein